MRPVCSTPLSASLSSRERLGQLVPDGADLQHHHADGVGDDVVELARDPRALLGDGDAGRRLALPLGLGSRAAPPPRPAAARSRSAKPASQPIANSTGMKTSSPARVVGVVVDDDRRAAEHDRQAEPRLHVVAEVAEQERGGHAGDERR